MRRWAIFFLVVAVAAAVVGFGGLDPDLTTYARIVFFASVLAAVFALAARRRGSV